MINNSEISVSHGYVIEIDNERHQTIAATAAEGENGPAICMREFAKKFNIKDEEILQSVFKLYDLDGDGLLDAAEQKRLREILSDPKARAEQAELLWTMVKSSNETLVLQESKLEELFKKSAKDAGLVLSEEALNELKEVFIEDFNREYRESGGAFKSIQFHVPPSLVDSPYGDDESPRTDIVECIEEESRQRAHSRISLRGRAKRRALIGGARSQRASAWILREEDLKPSSTSAASAAAAGGGDNTKRRRRRRKKTPTLCSSLYYGIRTETSYYVWMAILIIINLVFGGLGWAAGQFKLHKAFQICSYGLPIGVATRYMLTVDCALLLLFMCRYFWTWVKGTFLHKLLPPANEHIEFHMWTAYAVVLLSVIHSGAHLSNIYFITQAKPSTLNAALQNVHFTKSPSFIDLLFKTFVGVSGVVLVVSLTAIGATSLVKKIRTWNFEVFWYTHHVLIIFYAALFLHGFNRWFSFPYFWPIGGLAVFLYIVDRLTKEMRRFYHTRLVDFKCYPGEVMQLCFSKPSNYSYKPGQYLMLCCTQLSALQWHPFTITSSPIENVLQIHVKSLGNWTNNLQQLVVIQSHESRGLDEMKFAISGGFGAPTQDVFGFDVVMMIGAGIGFTPFAAILKDLHFRRESIKLLNPTGDMHFKLQRVYSYWMNREQDSFDWLGALIGDIQLKNADMMETHVYLTGAKSKNDMGTFFLRIAFDLYFTKYGEDGLTGLSTPTHWGRPQWQEIFTNVAAVHQGKRIGVFLCGPPVLGMEIEKQCRSFSSNSKKISFEFHPEHFGY